MRPIPRRAVFPDRHILAAARGHFLRAAPPPTRAGTFNSPAEAARGRGRDRKMNIPERLAQKLAEDTSLRSSVDAAVADFVPWLEDSKLPFFPDYTDHGTKHVEGVLVTASSLIGDEAWAAVTAQDVGVLILSALLHDCAMHITEDGFHALVAGRTHTKRIAGFGDADWPALWQEYLFSAKRFDDRTLTDLFGEPRPVRTPPSNVNEMTRADRVLIGEFVRRHHPRLAHEIALYGVPGPADRPIQLSGHLAPKLADLAGLVARSHGLPLRATFDYLNKHFHRREYKGVHAVFVMALLRIADYLQIQAERAPRQMLQVKKIRSPFSAREWAAHLSVDNITTYEDDPEAILIQATPPDVHTFLRLKGWLAGIQEELDGSWAVLGEVYGPRPELRPLGLVIRRVRSNLDDVRGFGELVSYVPRRVEFDISRSEILKLLVRPLYGDRPEIGIRELLQNSLDAVRELWDLQEHNPQLKAADLIEQEADVVMWLDEPDETGLATFTISDRGVGMTEEVIADYFLKVGASYRNSDAWAKQHEEAGAEPGGEPSLKSRVLRSGRFGIGALAAFLLGDEIEVTTRHVTAERGLRFRTRLESAPIEITFDDTLKVGTTVRVAVEQETFKDLTNRYGVILEEMNRVAYEHYLMQTSWDWYCLRKPSVQRLLGRERTVLPQALSLPSAGEELPVAWYEVSSDEYRAIYCTLMGQERGLVCNGIKVMDESGALFNVTQAFYTDGKVTRVISPLVCVFDPDGNLPLDLTRSRLSFDSFTETVYESKMKYALAYLLHAASSERRGVTELPAGLIHTEFRMSWRISTLPWVHVESGLSILEPWNILQTGARSFLVLTGDSAKKPLLSLPASQHEATLFLNVTPDSTNAVDTFNILLNGFGNFRDYQDQPFLPHRGGRLLTTAEHGSWIARHKTPSQMAEIREEWTDGRWVLLAFGDPPPTLFDVDYLETLPLPKTSADTIPMAAEWFLADEQPEIEPSNIAISWKEIIREPVIPYDPEERRMKLAHAYEVLAPYLERIKRDELAKEAEGQAKTRRKGRSRKK